MTGPLVLRLIVKNTFVNMCTMSGLWDIVSLRGTTGHANAACPLPVV
jgi:hypothetical protein